MLRAELRGLHSPDLPDLQGGVPEDPAHFGILVEASIGPSGSHGEDVFSFVVCTPSWLAAQVSSGQYRFLRHYLLVQSYDYHLIWSAIEKLCASISGPDWASVAGKLACYGAGSSRIIRSRSSHFSASSAPLRCHPDKC